MSGKHEGTNPLSGGGPTGTAGLRGYLPPAIVVGIGASSGSLAPLRVLLSGLSRGHGLTIVVVQPQTRADDLPVSLIAGQISLNVVEATDGTIIEADHVYIGPPARFMSVIDGKLSVRDGPRQGMAMPLDHFFCSLAVDAGRQAVAVLLSGTDGDGTAGLAAIRSQGGVAVILDPAAAECGPCDAILPPEKIAAFLMQRAQELFAEKYRIVSEYTYDWEFWIAPNGHLIYCSPSCERITGYSAEMFLADPSLRARLVHPDDRERFETHVKDVEDGRTDGRGEWRFLRPDGSYRWVEHVCQPVYDEKGGFLGVRGSNRDITERKAAEAEIQYLARQRQLALDAAQLGWWQYNPITRVASWDDGYKAIFGMSGYTKPNDEILRQIIHPDDLPALWAKVEEALRPAAPQPFAAEYRINRPDGQMRWIEAHGIATFEGEGVTRRAVNLVGTVADITDRKAVQDILRKENREITLANRVLRIFAEENDEDVFDKSLAVIQDGLASRHGVFGYILRPGHLVCPSLSKMLDTCEIEGKCIHYPPEKWKGLWARTLTEKHSLYTNEAPSVPSGHLIVHNNLATPILFRGEAIGLLNLANKEGGYSEEDRQVLDGIAARVAPVLYAWIQRMLREEERNAAEKALKQALAKAEAGDRMLAALMANVPEGITIGDAAGNIRMVSRHGQDLLGGQHADRSIEEVIRDWTVYRPDGQQVMPKEELPLVRALKGEEVRDIELVQVNAEGSMLPLLCNAAPIRDSAGQVVAAVVAWRDISERKRTEQALQKAHDELEKRVAERTGQLHQAAELAKAERQRFYDVLETLPVYVCLLTPDYQMPFANRIFREWFGYHPRRKCHEFLFHLSQPCENCKTYAVLKTNAPQRWEWTGPNGRDYDIFDFPFRDTDGSIHILEMGIDITERKQAEKVIKDLNETLEQRVAQRTAELRLTTEELRRSNEDLQQFAYISSHDLQEPLRMVNSFLKLLDQRYTSQLDDKARQYITFAVEGASQMSLLISDLLEYSRVDRSGREHKATDAGASLEAALANLRGAIQDAKAVVTSDALPTVLADSTQIMQLFQNLISNAIKFRSPDRPCQVHVSARRTGHGWWELAVRDNGIGIPRDAYERIFVIFQRLHTRDQYPGTGIGLALCKKIVERHGGRIRIESQPGEGTTFLFTLPEGDQ